MRISRISLSALLIAAFFVGGAADVTLHGALMAVRAPENHNTCAALDQSTGRIVGRWRPTAGVCSLQTFLWRRMFFLPDEEAPS